MDPFINNDKYEKILGIERRPVIEDKDEQEKEEDNKKTLVELNDTVSICKNSHDAFKELLDIREIVAEIQLTLDNNCGTTLVEDIPEPTCLRQNTEVNLYMIRDIKTQLQFIIQQL